MVGVLWAPALLRVAQHAYISDIKQLRLQSVLVHVHSRQHMGTNASP